MRNKLPSALQMSTLAAGSFKESVLVESGATGSAKEE